MDLIKWALGLYLLFSLLSVVMRWRKGFLKLGLKEGFQGLVIIFGLIWVTYALIFLAITVKPVVDVIKSVNPTDLGVYLPQFYILTGLGFLVYVLTCIFTYKPKYSEREQEFLKEERLQLKKKLGWFRRWLPN